MVEDNELIEDFKNGNQSAFEEILKKYKDRIYRVVLSIIQDKSESEDITQEVFLIVYARIDTFLGKSSLFSWIYGIAFNECRHALRDKKKNTVSLDCPLKDDDTLKIGDMLKSNEENHDSKLMSEERIRIINSIINTLPQKYKTAYILRNIDGLSYKEISEVLGISIEKVKVWLFRAREKLHESMEILCKNHESGGI